MPQQAASLHALTQHTVYDIVLEFVKNLQEGTKKILNKGKFKYAHNKEQVDDLNEKNPLEVELYKQSTRKET
jgi:hypothetical protein